MLFVSANEKRLQHQVYRQKIEIELLRTKLRQATNHLKQIKSKLMDYTNVKHDDKTLNFLTGIVSDSLFQWILSRTRSDVPRILKSYTVDNHLLLILMKLILCVSNRDLSCKFNIKEEYVSKIVRTWIPELANIFANLIVWPERSVERKPACMLQLF